LNKFHDVFILMIMISKSGKGNKKRHQTMPFF